MNDDPHHLTGTLAGRYAIEREIGRGGMATVYLARDTKHRRDVALKVLNADVAAAVGADRFLREIEIVARLSHPHIVPLYDSGRDDDLLFYVMPFVEGESLKDKLRREKQLGLEEAIAIARTVADALAHAHDHGVIHRDIKPGNIMLVADHALVADFGIATVTQAVSSERLTSSGVVLGTPLYMSPEQATGQQPVDARSDVYSLGCVLYEMLTGEPPFTGATAHVILARKLAGLPAAIRPIREAVADSLERVTLKALSRTVADRFRTAREFADRLETVELELRRGPAGGTAASGDVAVGVADREAIGPGRRAAEDTPGTPGREQRGASLTMIQKLVMAGGAVLLLLTLAGFLTTRVYDLTLRVPYGYTPTRTDFPFEGFRALISPLVFGFGFVVAWTIAKQVLRVINIALRRSTTMRRTMDRVSYEATRTWRTVRSRPSAAVAETWFVLAIVATAVVAAGFVATARSAAATDGGIFACTHRGAHRSYIFVLTTLIIVLAITWNLVFRRLAPADSSGRVVLPKWGGIALIVLLLLCLAAPWRLLWTTSPRALLDSQRYYIISETDANLLLFNPRTRVTELHRLEDIPQLRRLNTEGYVFESEQEFAGTEAGC